VTSTRARRRRSPKWLPRLPSNGSALSGRRWEVRPAATRSRRAAEAACYAAVLLATREFEILSDGMSAGRDLNDDGLALTPSNKYRDMGSRDLWLRKPVVTDSARASPAPRCTPSPNAGASLRHRVPSFPLLALDHAGKPALARAHDQHPRHASPRQTSPHQCERFADRRSRIQLSARASKS
jgi:hypothetical protein